MKKHPEFASKTPPFGCIFALFLALFAGGALAKTPIYMVKLGTVPAMGETVNTSAVVPAGKTVFVKKFGGLAPAVSSTVWSYAVLQWGSNAGGWDTVRVGYGTFEFSIGRDFTGDGTSRFRLVRRNKSPTGTPALEVAAWLEALVKD